jgi:hypothetical protein
VPKLTVAGVRPHRVRKEFGTYHDIFTSLFKHSIDLVATEKHVTQGPNAEYKLTVESYDVVNGDFPTEDRVKSADGLLITGSGQAPFAHSVPLATLVLIPAYQPRSTYGSRRRTLDPRPGRLHRAATIREPVAQDDRDLLWPASHLARVRDQVGSQRQGVGDWRPPDRVDRGGTASVYRTDAAGTLARSQVLSSSGFSSPGCSNLEGEVD